MSHDLRRGQRRQRSFRCGHCRADVPTRAVGTEHRNHCPSCLWSRHVDHTPGDRASTCGSLMQPIAQSPFPLELLAQL